ncbi:MAG: PKD domain-containing protein, partial [Chitinivibrionales bacterium]
EPTAVITVTPSDEVLTGDTVTFDGSASSDPDGNIVSWSWDLTGDGSTNSTDTVTTHTYSSAGTYTVSLEVEDDSGYTDVDSVEITVSDPQPPEAVINPDSVSGTDSVTVEFDGSGSDDPDGGNLTYKWYILEPSVEQVSSDSTFDTTFLIGDYTVVLEVTDDEGETDTDTALVSVTTSSAPQNQLTIYSSGDGSVDPNHDPAEGYDEGDTVDISTTPDADNQFYKWSGDTLDGVTDADPDIIMNTNRYVIADFRADSELVGTDIITNGDFTNSTNNWEFNYDGRDGAAGNFSTDSGALKINISDGGSADWHIQPRQTGLTFRKGYTYTVSFIARASASRPLNISLSQNYDPYKRYAQKDVTLTEEYQKFSFSFTHDTSSDSDSRICFNSGTDANDIWIDNVVVSEVSPCAGNNPPTAVYIDVVPSSEGDVNTNYEFVGSRSTDPDGNIDTYSWDFGDGSSATGDTVYHSYDSANIYTVTLTVIDECGDSLTNDMNVEVTGGEPTPDIIISQENTEYSADISSPKEVYMDTSNYNFGNLGIERESSSSTIQLNMEIDWLNGNTTVINDWSDNITVQSYYFKITDLGGETDLLLKGW